MSSGAVPVVLQSGDLTTHPICSNTRNGSTSVRYETRKRRYEISATTGLLPRSCDVPVLWYLLGRLQAKRLDQPEANSITIPIDQIVVSTGRKLQTNNRKSVATAISRYANMQVEISHKTKKTDSPPDLDKFTLFSADFTKTNAVTVTFSKEYLQVLKNLPKANRRYVALEHMIRMSGLASQLYGILLGPLSRKENSYEINARTLARKLFGEERGGKSKTMPCARFYNPYLIDALSEIFDKTRWAIDCEKRGYGENTVLVFSTVDLPRQHTERTNETVPNAWAVSRASRTVSPKNTATPRKTPKSRRATPCGKVAQSPLPKAIRQIVDTSTKTIGTGLAEVLAPVLSAHGEDGAIAVVQYALTKPLKGSVVGYLRGMGEGLMEYAEKHGPKIQERVKNAKWKQESRFRLIATDYIKTDEDRSHIIKQCKRHDFAIADFDDWFSKNQEWFMSKRAKYKAEVKRKDLQRISQKGSWLQHSAFYDAINIGTSDGYQAAINYCDKHDLDTVYVREYFERLSQE